MYNGRIIFRINLINTTIFLGAAKGIVGFGLISIYSNVDKVIKNNNNIKPIVPAATFNKYIPWLQIVPSWILSESLQ